MRIALVNPSWSFDGSIYFGCREPHLPIELAYSSALLGRAGHEAKVIDGQLRGLGIDLIRQETLDFRPDMVVITTAPSYLFWRCAPPELRVPQQTAAALRDAAPVMCVVGPHVSTTPRIAMRKLGADVGVLGECEEVLVQLANTPRDDWGAIPSVAVRSGQEVSVRGGPHASDMKSLPALRWDRQSLLLHAHHHHRFDQKPDGPGGELESSRGCPFSCTFCAKENFRNSFRRRPLELILEELDGMIESGATYVYFVDEIFMPDRPLLEALKQRPVRFGVQMRIDLWTPELLELLGAAGCVSIEAGLESVSMTGRDRLGKRCKLSTEQMVSLLVHARQHVPFVQANLIDAGSDDPREVVRWRDHLRGHGVWANDPVPLFPYPGSPDYTLRWGAPDDLAWERALDWYLELHERFSEIQDSRPLPLKRLELPILHD